MVSGLAQELLDRDLPQNCTLKQLYAEIGSPNDVARTLSEEIPNIEYQTYRHRRKVKKLITIISIAIATVIIGFILYRLIDIVHEMSKLEEVHVVSVITEYDPA